MVPYQSLSSESSMAPLFFCFMDVILGLLSVLILTRAPTEVHTATVLQKNGRECLSLSSHKKVKRGLTARVF